MLEMAFNPRLGKAERDFIYLSIICKSKSLSRLQHFVPLGLYSPWNSLGQNTGVDSLSLLQGIFPTQVLNPGLLHCRWILYKLSHKGKPSNSGMGRLSLLQWVLPTQESNQGLLDCRWILYQLSYQGTPDKHPVNCTKENLFLFFIFLNLYFYFILLYNTVLVLPYIDMNPPRVSVWRLNYLQMKKLRSRKAK